MSITLDDIIGAALEVQAEYTDEDLKRWYVEEKWTITRIARVSGMSRNTVYRHLQKIGAYDPPGKRGAQRKEKCKRGHSMEEHGVEVPKARGGGRYCRRCKLLNERARNGTYVEGDMW